jgi:hypothetical protein
MATKNGGNGATDPVGDSVDKILKLYDRIKQAAAQGVKREDVTIPEWDGVTLTVRALSADDRDDYEQWIANERRRLIDDGAGDDVRVRGIRAKVAVMCVVDGHGNHVFTDADLDWLGASEANALDRIFVVADRLSGLTGGAREEARKNSGETPSSASPTG